MKRFYVTLLVFFSFWAATVHAQITLTAQDYVQVGDQILFSSDSTTFLTPGNGGENQIWDFRSLLPQDTALIIIVDPASTPFADTFPTANQASLIIAGGDTAYTYQRLTTEQLVQLGIGVSLFAQELPETGPEAEFDVIRLESPELLATFPTTFGSGFRDTSLLTFSVTDEGGTLILRQSSSKEVSIDGWGTVRMPQGDFSALREKIITTTIDSIFLDLGIEGQEPLLIAGDLNVDTSYNFLAREAQGVLISFDTRFELDPNPDTPPYQVTFNLVEGLQAGQAPMADFLVVLDATTGEATFTDVSTNEPTSWAWDFGDGGSSSDQNPTYTFQMTGDFTVCLTASNAFGSNTNCQVLPIVLSEVNRLPEGSAFRVLSNPFVDQLQVQLTNWNRPAISIRIFNANGQQVFQSALRDQLTITTNQWSPGNYYYQLSDRDQVLQTGRLIRR